jgi:hypothetical protein
MGLKLKGEKEKSYLVVKMLRMTYSLFVETCENSETTERWTKKKKVLK